MFRLIAAVFLGFMLITGLAAPAGAVDINVDGAKTLKAIFERQIEYQKAFASIQNAAKLEFDGSVSVEPAGDFYAVTLPYTRVTYPDGDRLDIGMISINASPHTVPGQWKMVVAVPTPLVKFDSANQQIMRLSFGGQRFAGIWDEGLEYFAKLDATYHDVVIENAAPQFTHTIGEVTTRIDLEKDAANKWSGPGSVEFKNVTFDFDNSAISGSAESAKAAFDMDRYDPVILKNYREQLIALMENDKEAPAARVSPEHVTALYNMILDTLLKSNNGLSARYAINNFELARKDKKTELAAGYIDLALAELLSGQASFTARLGFSGLKNTPATEESDLQPEEANIDLKIEKIPFTSIAELGRNSIQSISTNPQMAQIILPGLLFQLPALMAQAGTNVTIKDNFAGNKLYRTELNGTARADAGAVNGFTAEARGVFRGLDKVLAKTQVLAANPQNTYAEKYRDISRTLETLKDIGKVEAQPDGQFIHIFDFLVNQQGQATVNGKDIQSVFTGRPPLPEPEPPPESAPPP